jgi:hypothetical protein
VATRIPASSSVSVLGSEGENMTVSLSIRENRGRQAPLRQTRQEKDLPDGVVFCLRHAADDKRRWEYPSRNQPECRARGESNQGSGTTIGPRSSIFTVARIACVFTIVSPLRRTHH